MATEAAIYEGLTEVFHDVLGGDSLLLAPTLPANRVTGGDSVRMVTIILCAERHSAVKLRSRELDQLKNVGDPARPVRARLA